MTCGAGRHHLVCLIELATTQMTAVRWQQLWERALQEYILHRHESPRGVHLQRPATRRRQHPTAQLRGDRQRQHFLWSSLTTPFTFSAVKRLDVQVDSCGREWFLDMSCHCH